MQRMLVSLVVIVVACSPSDRESPRPSPVEHPPVLTDRQKQDLGREVITQANAGVDASTSRCGVPPAFERVEAAGTLTVSTFGGKTTYNYVGDLRGIEGARLSIYASKAAKPGSIQLRPRRDRDDFTRPYVVELSLGDRALDAVAGTLVIDKVDGATVTGHLDTVELRERAYDFAEVANGCKTRITHAEFRYVRRE